MPPPDELPDVWTVVPQQGTELDSPGSVPPPDELPDVRTVVPQQGTEAESPGSVTQFEDSQESAPFPQHDTESSSVDSNHEVKS